MAGTGSVSTHRRPSSDPSSRHSRPPVARRTRRRWQAGPATSRTSPPANSRAHCSETLKTCKKRQNSGRAQSYERPNRRLQRDLGPRSNDSKSTRRRGHLTRRSSLDAREQPRRLSPTSVRRHPGTLSDRTADHLTSRSAGSEHSTAPIRPVTGRLQHARFAPATRLPPYERVHDGGEKDERIAGLPIVSKACAGVPTRRVPRISLTIECSQRNPLADHRRRANR